MLPADFQERNKIYTKPKEWTDEECSDLYVYEGVENETGRPFCASLWMPSKEDIEAVLAGRGIVIKLSIPVQCPIAVWTVDENGEVN